MKARDVRPPESTVGIMSVYWVRYPVWQHTFVSPSAFSRRAAVSYWRKYVHEVLVNRLGGLSLPRKSVVRLTDRPDMTIDVYRGRKTTIQHKCLCKFLEICLFKCNFELFFSCTQNIPNKYAESIKFDAKQLGKKLCIRHEGWRIRIN